MLKYSRAKIIGVTEPIFIEFSKGYFTKPCKSYMNLNTLILNTGKNQIDLRMLKTSKILNKIEAKESEFIIPSDSFITSNKTSVTIGRILPGNYAIIPGGFTWWIFSDSSNVQNSQVIKWCFGDVTT